MHENKTFYFFIFFMKIGYFNAGFVSLQYKNTNQYWSNYSKKIQKITDFFEIIFSKRNFFF